MPGLTLDSGALIAFARADRRLMALLKSAERTGEELTVPTVVLTEVWRGGPRAARIASLLESCIVEPLFEDLARQAGEAIGAVGHAGAVDAIVMASAAHRGDLVLTSDFCDLDRFRSRFPGVRVLRV
jgi:predicted nucleic acid-binding protein